MSPRSSPKNDPPEATTWSDMPVVCDASALVEVGLRTAKGARVLEALRDNEAAAPDLVNAEVLHAFRRIVQLGALDAGRAQAGIDLLATMGVRRVGTTGLMGRIWALRDNLTPYDATYVALAEALSCPLVTADRRLAASPVVDVAVVLV